MNDDNDVYSRRYSWTDHSQQRDSDIQADDSSIDATELSKFDAMMREANKIFHRHVDSLLVPLPLKEEVFRIEGAESTQT